MLRRLPLAAVLLASISCGDGRDPLSAPILLETPRPGYTSSDRHALVTMEVSGAESVRIERARAVLHFEEILGSRVPQITWFFSVSSVPGDGSWITLPDGRKLIFTADLSPGLYTGPGTYQLSPVKAGANVGGTSGIASAAYVALLKPPPSPSEVRFNELMQPCTLRVGEALREGSVDCPKLGGSGGKTVALRWSWQLT